MTTLAGIADMATTMERWAYLLAVVARSEPLALTSLDADMLWTATTRDMQLERVGRASKKQLDLGLKRLAREPKS